MKNELRSRSFNGEAAGFWPRTLSRALASGAALLSGALALNGCGGEAPESLDRLSQGLSQSRVEAEAFNRYFDSDTAHSGNCGTGPVDAEVTADPKGGTCHVGWTTAGEWLEYDVNVPQAGNYDVVLRVASAQTGRTLHVDVDGINRSGAVTAPSSGFQAFADRKFNVPLTAGAHVIRVAFDTGSVNLNYLELNQTTAPEVIVAANFANDLENFFYNDISPDNTVDGTQANGRLQMTLGGTDNVTVQDMRGSFTRMFWVPAYEEVTVSFDYWLEQSCSYETDESSELLATMDGIPLTGTTPRVAQIFGNGNACPGVSTSGNYTKTFTLAPGKHHLQLVGVNSQKTDSTELTTLKVDNVLITASSAQCTASQSQTYTNLCNACDGLLNCQGSCTVNFPSNVGAPCGACGGVVKCDGTCSEPLNAPCGVPPTPVERLRACDKDPRVVAGLVSRDVCTGADVFFRETFGGNGRTCGSCHPVANNYTIDPAFVQALQASNPNDPLFVAKAGTQLEHLETSDLTSNALILENVDGFQDPANRFVTRSVPHLFSLAITMAPDPADGSTNPPVERTGWAGDGAPGDGSLRSFLDGAINQHFTKTLSRVPGLDFRPATDLERDVVEAFQRTLGRQNELDLASVIFNNSTAQEGKGKFLDPAQGRCGVCHSNAGATFVKSGLNRNFNNGISGQQTLGKLVDYFGPGEDLILADGGFGGADLTDPNVDPSGIGFFNAFGDGNFNVPPLVEAADTAPFFHNNADVGRAFQTQLGRVLFFYGTGGFQFSSGAQFLESQPEFGPTNINAETTNGIAPMLVVLNAVFNIDLARQRLQAAEKLATDLRAIRADVQVQLMLLAGEEIEDAIRVLSDESIHESERNTLQGVFNQLRTVNASTLWSTRRTVITTALANLNNVRPLFGSNFNYQLGEGTLMY
jgi:hypothetical protein